MTSSARFTVISPADDSVYYEGALAGPTELDQALTRAVSAQREWGRQPLAVRVDGVRRFLDEVEKVRDEAADELTAQMGRPRAQAPSELAGFLDRGRTMARLAGDALTVNACHPGVVRTGLLRRGNRVQRLAFRAMGPFLIDAATAARVPLRLATDPVLTGVSGRYFDAAGEKRPSVQALDPDLAAALWTRSARLAADAQGAAGSDSAPDCC